MTSRLDRVMAYVDGELDAGERRAFEAEMAADPTLAAEVAAHRGLSAQLAAAYDPVLEEPSPLRLTLAARTVNDPGPRREGWWRWAAMAACLVVGVVGGRLSLSGAPGVAVGADLAPRTQLARALDRQLAAEPGPIRIGLTFRDANGRYCRTFESAPDRLAGLACREGDGWRLRTATSVMATPQAEYRTAGSDTPPEVLAAVDRTLAGDTLDAAQEKAARDRRWR